MLASVLQSAINDMLIIEEALAATSTSGEESLVGTRVDL